MQSTTKTFIEIDHIDESLFVDDDYVYDESKLPSLLQSQDLSQLENQFNTADVDTSDLDAAWANGYYDETKRSPMFQSQEWGTAYDDYMPRTNPLLESCMFDDYEDGSVEDISIDLDKIAKEEIWWELYGEDYYDEDSDEECYFGDDEYENDDKEQM
jgi:hypothetical protein